MKPTAMSIILVLATFTGSILPRTVGEVFAKRRERVLCYGGSGLNFSGEAIDSLEGLDAVAKKYPDIQTLFLHANNIAHIPANAFAGFNKLQWLCLTGNLLTDSSFELGWDAGLEGLQKIWLTDNPIERVAHLEELLVTLLPEANIRLPEAKQKPRSTAIPMANPFELHGSKFDDVD